MKNAARVTASYIIVAAIYILGIPFIITYLGRYVSILLGLERLFSPRWAGLCGAAVTGYAWFWIVWSQASLVSMGRGHPNEILGRELAPTTRRLVRSGPYRRVRNPMAYGLIVFYFAGLPLLFNAPALLLFFPAACLFETWYHRRFEEPGLLRKFGAEYENYRREVPLLFPFLGRF